MRFEPTDVIGCFVVEPTSRGDHRGFFARMFDAEAFRDQGLAERFVQVNNSMSSEAGTLRGLHMQVSPAGEDKLLRCIAGTVFDVVLDLRAGSASFGRWAAAEISAENRQLMYAPKGCAHGFMTLVPRSEVIYLTSAPYSGEHERIVRWNDPSFAIRWPREPAVLSAKDQAAPDFDPVRQASGY